MFSLWWENLLDISQEIDGNYFTNSITYKIWLNSKWYTIEQKNLWHQI